MFLTTDSFSWTSGAGTCEGRIMFKSKVTLDVCLALCEQLEECMTVNYDIDNGGCSAIHMVPCLLNATQPTGNHIFFTKWSKFI